MSDRIAFRQFRVRVVEPVLGYLGLPGGEAAIRLLLGTAAQETQLKRLAQYPAGPALGPYQIEPATHTDLWERFPAPDRGLRAKVLALLAPYPDRAQQLASNAGYATAIARVLYFRAAEPLPGSSDLPGLARYYKRFWNTGKGAATEEEFIVNYRTLVGDP